MDSGLSNLCISINSAIGYRILKDVSNERWDVKYHVVLYFGNINAIMHNMKENITLIK